MIRPPLVSVAVALLMWLHVGAGLSPALAENPETVPYQSKYASEATAKFAPIADWPGCAP
jgi:hypothetical protein